MRRADLILGLVAAAVGAYALALALDLAAFSASGQPGPGFFPRLISGLLTFLGLLLAAVSLRRRRQPADGGSGAAPAQASGPGPAAEAAPSAASEPASATAQERAAALAAVAGEDAPDPPAPGRRVLRAGTVWLCFALSMPLLVLLGFVPAAAVLVLVLLFGVEGRRNWRSVLVAIILPVAASVVFTKLLSVPLPQGLLSHGPLGI